MKLIVLVTTMVLVLVCTMFVFQLSSSSTEPYQATPPMVSSGVSECADGLYSKRTLKLAYELTFPALFRDTKGMNKFEASSVIVMDDGFVYAVCDSSWSIFKFDSQLQPFLKTNVLIGNPNRVPEEDSGYEALFHVNKTLYAVRESIQDAEGEYHAIIEEIDPTEDNDYNVSHVCWAEFEFEGNSKGFEGAVPLQDLNNELVVLGLCEGNHCSQSHKKKMDVGNGRVVIMRKSHYVNKHGERVCQWSTVREIKVPTSAAFLDYSAMSVDASGRVAISSQENSQLWVGQLLGQNSEGLWDVDELEFDHSGGVVYTFPKNDNCETIYCNIEGVSWLDSHTIIAVSDKMKGGGRQDFRCFDKDQSVHVFKLP